MNLYAECVCKRLGYAEYRRRLLGDRHRRRRAISLLALKVSPSEYHLDDGCGLSKQNAISSHLMLTVLAHDFYGPNAKIWLGSLAVAGEDGTLMERFRGTDLRGRVIAKTGFVNGVSCLSGYLFAKDKTGTSSASSSTASPPAPTAAPRNCRNELFALWINICGRFLSHEATE